MTKEQIKKSIETGELDLKFTDKFTHYGIVGFLLIIPATLLMYTLFIGIPKQPRVELILFVLVPTLLALLFYKLQKKRLEFESVNTTLTREEVAEIIKEVGEELNWHPFLNKDKIYIAKTYPGLLSGSWGEQITVLFGRNRVFINSICDPDKNSSVVSFGRNRKNMNALLNKIEGASRQQKLKASTH